MASTPHPLTETNVAARAAWQRLPATTAIVFDGDCGLCDLSVRSLARCDHRGRLIFAPLQGLTARRLLAGIVDSSQALSRDGSIHFVHSSMKKTISATRRSDAIIAILNTLGQPGLAMALRLLPRPIRDLGYRLVARWRHRLFKPPVCSLHQRHMIRVLP